MENKDELLLEIYKLQQNCKEKLKTARTNYRKGQLLGFIHAYQNIIELIEKK